MRHRFRWSATAIATLTAVAVVATGSVGAADSRVLERPDMAVAAEPLPPPNDPCDTDAARRYVAGGDAVVLGAKNDDPSELPASDRYSEKLLTKLQQTPGPWCLFNTSKNPTDTDQYVAEGSPTQQAKAHDLRPRLITLTLGRQNATIVDHVVRCFKNVKDHDFLDANTCALAVLGNAAAWEELTRDLSEILNRFMVQMDGNPQLVVAVTGYFNPYPAATSVATEVPGFCAKLQDTIPTCTIRWILLPPALVTLDLVVKKLNETIKSVVDMFTWTSQGRFFFVNPYEKFKDHCMKLEVEIKTKVYHPPNTVHQHDSKNDFGCDEPWVASDTHDGTKSPFPYLTPAVTGVLILATQTTKGMGIYPNAKGHECIADLVWQATKNKLGVPEPPEDACTDV
ncbi:MAG TPA: hypothetical protein VFB84_14110 [Micromonosporaceae bacterium]|nr:hypothetical protein [Micromonosporaceae bacterium]